MDRLFTTVCKAREIKNKLREIEQELNEKGFFTSKNTTNLGGMQR